MKQPIELRRVRDFGQIINDSFTFFKENLKPLLKVLFIICGFFIVIGCISTISTYLNMSSFYAMDSNRFDSSKPLAYLVNVLINAFITLITQAFIHLTTLCYISVYLEKNNTTPTLAEVWGYFRYYFFRVLGSSIVVFFVLGLGFLFCIIPGIYLMPIVYLIIPIIVIENSSFGYAFNKSFRLIKDNWWVVFGVIFIMSLIISISGSIASIPLSVIGVSSKFLSLKAFKLPLIIIFSILHNMIMLAYAIPAIAISMCYFNLSEQKEGTGLLGRIDKIGKDTDDTSTLPAEEY
ncbi:hypothetical protein [Mucilaginibacter sp. OK098]|uniref:hypothetical protein n=1 Tax=Mucilaginibacter sp. OK098 TaxID=1855297 RepID=UPI000923EADC|nr:hypothetical protein [Mucilaginibacter sp. OK098]SHN16655.1 hypothetical protein SAMN05216524_10638 [Mucilaginibacter sp. OK098]